MLSILITSFNRSQLLTIHLNRLVEQVKNFEYEIIVINDGIEDETKKLCDKYTDKLNIKYLFTGQRNDNGLIWRVPGFPLNIGFKYCCGEYVIITCAEMYPVEDDVIQCIYDTLVSNPRCLVHTEGRMDGGRYLRNLIQNNNHSQEIYDNLMSLHTQYPFYVGLPKKEALDIGGYDEDFTGVGWDDTDFIRRLVQNGSKWEFVYRKVVHLKHKRKRVIGCPAWKYNEALYKHRENVIVRNTGREWGVL